MILITGSSGHIGNVLVRKLVHLGETVAILTKTGLKPEWLSDLDLVVFKADLRDFEAVELAVSKSKVVFHLGGMISISSFRSYKLYQINVIGTQNIIDACLKHGISRLIFTSSVHALKQGEKDSIISATGIVDPKELFGAYSKTKAEATNRILKAIDKGLDAVICFPSAVMGPYDFRGSEAGKMISEFATNKLQAYVDGKYNFVDVRDVANGLINAWKVGNTGGLYILAGEQMSLEQFFDILSNLEPRMIKPNIKIPVPIAIFTGWILEIIGYIFSIKPLFTAYGIKVLQSNCQFDMQAAFNDLDYKPRPIKDTLRDSLSWLKEHNKI